MTDKIEKSEQAWLAQLTPEQYYVCRQHGTERPFSGEYDACKAAGVYRCACCGNELFGSETKFDSGSGWPSFWAPVSDQAVGTDQDISLAMNRTEVHCARCDAHLGHVFADGPAPTNLRYCMNSVALALERK